jgi:hypothetical protein
MLLTLLENLRFNQQGRFLILNLIRKTKSKKRMRTMRLKANTANKAIAIHIQLKSIIKITWDNNTQKDRAIVIIEYMRRSNSKKCRKSINKI